MPVENREYSNQLQTVVSLLNQNDVQQNYSYISCIFIIIEKSIGGSCTDDGHCLEANSLCMHKKCFCSATSIYNTTTGSCDIGKHFEVLSVYTLKQGVVIPFNYHMTSPLSSG